jgi:anti-anti-sigma regulatory factor
MMLRERIVVVRHFPEKLAGSERSAFFSEIKHCVDVDRPSLVLDCSSLARMDKQIVLLLLCCLEEAMKRNGDVRLAGLSPQARAVLKAAGADILFRFFETTADAIASFHSSAMNLPLRVGTQTTGESAV